MVREAAVDDLQRFDARRGHPLRAQSLQGLTRFLEDGRLDLDTNPVENAIRPVCLTRKNALFAGHEVGAENWALLASIVATRKLNDVNPAAYIAETLEAIIDGHPLSRIEDLMPRRFRKSSSQPQ
ncbi:hypothetical protein ABIC09_007266 [Bradyrhizobium sp. S3.12.5]